MYMVSMRFTTGLDDTDLEKISRGGLQKFREVDGLNQKFYVRNYGNGQVGGVYLFESQKQAEAYVNGPIVASVGERFKVEGEVDIEMLDIVLSLDEA